ncbi:unnamed protein product [Rhodiola kirilowii]
MTTVPGPLIWEIVKRNNSFLVEKFANGNASVRFSKESNNLYNLNYYKHSGLANKKTVTIQTGKENAVVISTTKTKQNKPALLRNKSVLKKDFIRMVKAVSNQNFFDDHSTRATEARDLACLPVSPKKKFASSSPGYNFQILDSPLLLMNIWIF